MILLGKGTKAAVKAQPFGDATLMELFGFSRSCYGSSRRGEELWLMELHVEVERLHVEVKCYGQLDFT